VQFRRMRAAHYKLGDGARFRGSSSVRRRLLKESGSDVFTIHNLVSHNYYIRSIETQSQFGNMLGIPKHVC
jgi:hypothetical protein